MKSRVFVLIKLMEELGLPVSRLMGQSSNVLPITKPVLTKSTIDLSSVNTKSLAKESTDTLNLLRNNKLSGQEIEQTIRNLQDIKATTQAKPRSATIIKLSTKEAIPTEGVMNLAKQQEMFKSIPGKAKQLQGRVENIEKDFTDFTKALDARGEIPGASRQEAIEIAKAKMKGMGYAAEEIEDIAKDPKRIQIATDIIIPDEGFQMGGRVGFKEGSGYFSNLIKENIPPEYRLYAKSILPGGKKGNVDESYFTEDFKKDLRQQVLTKFKETGKSKGSIGELDTHYRSGAKKYGQGEKYPINKLIGLPSTYATLGSYNYEIDPETLDVKIKDTYDWNPAYGKDSSSGKTGWVGDKKGKDVDTSMLKDYVMQSLQTGEIDKGDALELLGNYLGPKASKGEGINVDIDIPAQDISMGEGETFAVGGRVEMAGGGITALKTLIRFLGKDSGKKGSQMLKEINPKQFGYKFDMLDPEMKKQINDNRLEYIEQLSDSIKSDRKLLREIKDMPKEWQDFMYKQANEGGNKGRLDVYNKIDIDDAIGEIEQLKKNLEFKNIPAKEVKRKMNSEGGRIEMAGGGLGRYVLKLLGKKGKDLTGQTKQFREGPITSKFLEEVDSEVLDPFIRTRDTSGRGGYGLYKDFEEMPAGLKAAEFISRIKTKNGSIDYGKAEAFIGTKLKGTESIDELIEMVSTPQRIKKAVGGSVYDQYQNYLNQVNSQSSDPLYSNILYNQPSMNDTGSGDDDIDVTKDQTVGSSKALDYYNNNLGYLGRTGVNSLIGMVNPMLGAVGQMYNQGKSLYDVGRNVLGYNNFGRTMGYDFYGDLGGGIADPSTGSFSTNPGIGFSNRDPEDTQDYGNDSHGGANDPGNTSGGFGGDDDE